MLLLLAAACSDAVVTKQNTPPLATITWPTAADAFVEGDAVELRGTAADTEDDSASLVVTWYAGTSQLCGPTAPAADGSTTCPITASPDQTGISLEVRDPAGEVGVATVTLGVEGDAAPEVDLVAPLDGSRWYSDRLLVLEGRVGDDHDAVEDLVVTWSSNADGEIDAATVDSDGTVHGAVYLSEGEHQLTLAAADGGGRRGSDSVLLDVAGPNTPPTCAITEPGDGAVGEPGVPLTLRGVAGDAEEPATGLSASWSSDRDGALGSSSPSSAGDVALSVTLSAATHVLTLTVTDELGEVCTDLVVYTAGSPPSARIDTPITGEVVNEGDAVDLTGLAGDVEDDPGALDVRWESDLDGVLDRSPADASGALDASVAGLSVGDHRLVLTVTDSDGLSATDEVRLTVNGLPGAPGVSLAPATPMTGDDLVASVDAPSVDPEGDAVSYTWAWYRDGVLSGASTTSTLPASATTRGETWEVVATPSDGYGAGSAGRASVTIGNTPPQATSVGLTPSPVASDGTLTCSATGSDEDGDTVSFSYAWSVSGSPTGATGATLAAPWFAPGDVVTCVATPTDGIDAGAAATSAGSTVNHPPAVDTVAVSPAAPTGDDELTCTAGVSDADGDTVTTSIAWSIDGVTVGTGATLAASVTRSGDVVTCTVTASDALESGRGSATVTIVNTAPVVGAVSISPPTAYTDTTLTASGSASDADGDAVTLAYTWYVDGVAAGTGGTLGGAAFARGQRVTVEAVADDGDLSSAPLASSPVVIRNSAPGAATVTVTPTTMDANDTDLVCVLVVGSGDADGDTVTYGFTWTLDGVPWTGGTDTTTWPGDTIAAADAAQGTWACTVEPDDGTDVGPTASSSALVDSGATFFVELDAGEATCAKDEDGYLTCWGDRGFGVDEPPTEPVLDFGMSQYTGCAILTDQTLSCWGWDGGYGLTTPPSGTYVSVDVNNRHACAVSTAGRVTCWGNDNGDGWDLGQVTETPTTSGWASVSTGSYHSCGITTAGALDCWGAHADSGEPSGTFTTGEGGLAVQCELGTDGDVDCWGSGGYLDESMAPTSNVVGISMAYSHLCYVESDGTGDCVGDVVNDYNQVDDTPTLTGLVDIAAGYWHSIAVFEDGSMQGWGRNAYGESSPPP